MQWAEIERTALFSSLIEMDCSYGDLYVIVYIFLMVKIRILETPSKENTQCLIGITGSGKDVPLGELLSLVP